MARNIKDGDFPLALLSYVDHSLVIKKDDKLIKMSAPRELHKDSNAYAEDVIESDFVHKSDNLLTFLLEYEVDDVNKGYSIQDMQLDFRFNDNKEDGIALILEQMSLKKKENLDGKSKYMLIKDINLKSNVESFNNKNRYKVTLGKIEDNQSIISKYGLGVYAIEYIVRLKVGDNAFNRDQSRVIVRNNCTIKMFTDNSEVPSFTEPDTQKHKTYIEFEVLR